MLTSCPRHLQLFEVINTTVLKKQITYLLYQQNHKFSKWRNLEFSISLLIADRPMMDIRQIAIKSELMTGHQEERDFCHCLWHAITIKSSLCRKYCFVLIFPLAIRTWNTDAALAENKENDGGKQFLMDKTSYHSVWRVLR